MAVRGIAIASGQSVPSPTFTGTVTFPDGSTWTSTAITITNPKMGYGANGLSLNPVGIASPPADLAAYALHTVGNNTSANVMLMDVSPGSPTITGRRTGTSYAAPSGVTINSAILSVTGNGFGTTIYAASDPVAMIYRSSEAWTDSARGSRIEFSTTLSTTLTRSIVLTLADDGTIVFNKINYTVATLPAAVAGNKGAQTYITDGAAVPVFGAIVVGGGSLFLPVFCDGANWRNG